MNNEIIVTEGREVISTRNDILASVQGPTIPSIENLNISHSSEVNVGPEFVSITQNVNKVELIKGKFLGVELVSLKRPNRLRCGVIVFLCWSLLAAAGLIVYLVSITRSIPSRLDISLDAPWYLRREDWHALPAYDWIYTFLELPLPYVIIGHSAASGCETEITCKQRIRDIQQNHQMRGLGDIGPNFLVGGEGYVFEGRGVNLVGAMVTGWNVRSITIMFMGYYAEMHPNQFQFDHLNILLENLVEERVLRQDYTVYGQCQVRTWTASPGRHIMAQMNNFAHWNSSGANQCL